MKLTEILIAIVLWVASVAGAVWFGMDYKEASMIREDSRMNKAIEDTRKAANEGAADAISKIVVRNTTVQGRVETIVRDNPVYRDCKHDPDSMRSINEALTGRSGPVGSGSMP